jgi:hypothetical protein
MKLVITPASTDVLAHGTVFEARFGQGIPE